MPGTWADVMELTTRTLIRSMPVGSSGSFTWIWTVLPAMQGVIGGGAGSLVVGVVLVTKGAPATASMNGDTQPPPVGQPHVRKHVVAPVSIRSPSTTMTLGDVVPNGTDTA